RLGHSAMVGSMSGLPESGHGGAVYEYTPWLVKQSFNIKNKTTKKKQYNPQREKNEAGHDSKHSCDIDQTADDDMPICYYRPPANAPGRRAPLISVYTTTLPLKLGTTSATYG